MTTEDDNQARSGVGADLVISSGAVWTGLDCPVGGTVGGGPTAIAVRGGTITAIGSDQDVAEWIGSETLVVDAAGKRVIPGLIDSHIHAVRAGFSYLDELDWTEVYSLEHALRTVAEAAATRPEGEWITVMGGWHPTQFTDHKRMPTSSELDATAPRHPVFVHPLYGHDDHAVLNATGLEALGFGADSPDPETGVLGRREDGTLDGTVRGLGFYQELAAVALQPSPERAIESSRAFFQRLAALGLTCVVDAGGLGMGPEKYRPIRALWRRGGLPIRVRTNLGARGRGTEAAEVATWLDVLDPGIGDDLLSVLGVGEVLQFGCHDWEGMAPFPITDAAYAELLDTMRSAAASGWPLTIHAILDSSVSTVLDAIEEVAAQHPVAALRWNICHAECIEPANLARVQRLGIGLALQGRLSHKATVVADRWGEDVVRHAPPLGDIVDLGIPFGGGTDSTRGASYNPWNALWWFVTGRSIDDGPRRDERHRLDRAKALDAYTRGSAWFSFEDDRRGMLAVGADADFAILDRDYFAVDEDDIRSLGSELTVVAGRVVHRSGQFAALPLQDHRARPGPTEPEQAG